MKPKFLFLFSLSLIIYSCSNHTDNKSHYRRKFHFKDFAFTTPVGLRFFITRDSLKGIISDGYINGDTLTESKIRLDISAMFMSPPVYDKSAVILKSTTIGSVKKKLVIYKLPDDFNNVEIDAWDTTIIDRLRQHSASYYNIVMGGRKIRNDQMGKIIELFNSVKSAAIPEKSASTKKSDAISI